MTVSGSCNLQGNYAKIIMSALWERARFRDEIKPTRSGEKAIAEARLHYYISTISYLNYE